MPTSRRNAIRDPGPVFERIDAVLLPQGFSRVDNVYHRRADQDVHPRVEAITLGFAYGFRTCWMHTTVKIPALIELLASARGSSYREANAWRVPAPAALVACMLRLSELEGARQLPLPAGLHWRHDGRWQRARTMPAQTLGETLALFAERLALPALRQRLTLDRIAAAADASGYAASGAAGAWPLLARLALGDVQGAAAAFRRHPYALGSSRAEVISAKAWLRGCGVEVEDVPWSAAAANAADPITARRWLTGELVT